MLTATQTPSTKQNGAKKTQRQRTAVFAMAALLLSSPSPLLLLHGSSKPILLHARRRVGRIPNAAPNNGNSSGDTSTAASDADTTSSADTIASPSESPPPSNGKPTSMKNRLRARNQARRVQLDAPPEMVVTPKKKAPAAAAPARRESGQKKWEEMSLAEKALELYVGEKGLLFWLNKFAYASIFIMVGAWILFRFVGPSLGLYQLDAPPLPPTAVFSG